MATVTAKKNAVTDTPESPVNPVLSTGSDVVPADVEKPLIYVDRVFTSRTLILSSDRTVPVSQGRVSVEPDDAELLALLVNHPDFSPAE